MVENEVLIPRGDFINYNGGLSLAAKIKLAISLPYIWSDGEALTHIENSTL